MTAKTAYRLFITAAKDFNADDATTLGAALSFYTALSLAPLLVILMYIAGVISDNAQHQFINEIQSLLGMEAGNVIRIIIDNAQAQRASGFISAIIGIGTLLISATVVFTQLQAAMNRIWNVEAKPDRGAIWSWLRKRLMSLGIVAGIGFLLLVSLAISAALNLVFVSEGLFWKMLDFGVSLFVYTLAFALLFKILPDVKLLWRDVSGGAALTAILFVVGKWAIGKYLGYSSVGSAYGAAGSLVVLLVWVYYSTLILFFGAELTQSYARYRGAKHPPEEHAVKDPAAEAKKTEAERGTK